MESQGAAPKKNLNGIRGWLLFFNIQVWLALLIYTLSIVGSLGLTGGDKVFNLVFSIPAAVLLFLVLTNMSRRNIRFRTFYAAFAALSVLSLIVMMARGYQLQEVSDLPVGPVLWLIYLYKSARVRITFGPSQQQDAAPADGESAGANAPGEPALPEGEGAQGGPVAELTYFYLPSCPHCRLATGCIEQLRQQDPRYRQIEINMVDESAEKELAARYDYYYVPAFFLGNDKLYEGHAEMENVKAVLDAALEKASAGEQDPV